MQNNSFDHEKITQDMVHALIKERRSERLWKNIRFFTVFLIIGAIIFSVFGEKRSIATDDSKEYVALIRLDGMIAPSESFSAEAVLPLLKDAFKDRDAKGVILDINSGGGTPVQAAIIHDAIIEFKKKYHKPVIVVGEDMLASGAYYVAVAADKIYVNPNTLTGSIGVIMKTFGFQDAIKKLGVERRVYTAGENKDRLDPFLQQNPLDVEKIKTVIGEVHQNFIDVVMEGRKGKLKADPKVLFSGDFWSGKSALQLGLVDGLGNLSDVMQKEFRVNRYKDYSEEASVLKTLLSQMGVALNTAFTSNNQTKVLMNLQ